jgi:hypothetical protein
MARGFLGGLDRGSSVEGVMGGPGTSPMAGRGAPRDARMTELWQRQAGMGRSWSPGESEGSQGLSAFERAAGVREYSIGEAVGGGRPGWASEPSPAANPAVKPRSSSLGSPLAWDYSLDSGMASSLDPVLGIAPVGPGAGSLTRTDSWSPSLAPVVPGMPGVMGPASVSEVRAGLVSTIPVALGQHDVPRTIRELVEGPAGLRGRQGELLFGGENAARRELNPFLPREELELNQDLRLGEVTGGGTGFPGGRPYVSGPSSALRELTERVAGPSSLAPATALPGAELARPPRKTSLIEFPTRKF